MMDLAATGFEPPTFRLLARVPTATPRSPYYSYRYFGWHIKNLVRLFALFFEIAAKFFILTLKINAFGSLSNF